MKNVTEYLLDIACRPDDIEDGIAVPFNLDTFLRLQTEQRAQAIIANSMFMMECAASPQVSAAFDIDPTNDLMRTMMLGTLFGIKVFIDVSGCNMLAGGGRVMYVVEADDTLTRHQIED